MITKKGWLMVTLAEIAMRYAIKAKATNAVHPFGLRSVRLITSASAGHEESSIEDPYRRRVR
jgi:hypothetical protein